MSNKLKEIQEKCLEPLATELATGVSEVLNSSERVQAYVKHRFENVFLVDLIEAIDPDLSLGSSSPLASALWMNRAEELGKVEEYGTEDHEEGRLRVAQAVDVELTSCRSEVIELLLEIGSIHYLLGVFYYIEYQVPQEYEALMKAIKLFFPNATEDDLYHLTNHIEHDEFHFKDLSFALSLGRNLDFEQFEAGIRFMHRQRMKLLQIVLAS